MPLRPALLRCLGVNAVLLLHVGLAVPLSSKGTAQPACLTPVPGAEIGHGLDLGRLPGDGALVNAERGWFRYDPKAKRLAPVPSPETGKVFDIWDLPGGDLPAR